MLDPVEILEIVLADQLVEIDRLRATVTLLEDRRARLFDRVTQADLELGKLRELVNSQAAEIQALVKWSDTAV